MELFIGCSGYSYKDWKGIFYPNDLTQKQWLSFYAEKFNTVEINNTFYRFPEDKLFQKWLDQTPGHFRFTIKGHRFFTHQKKLKIDETFGERLDDFHTSLKPLKDRAGCILWQLPGNLHKNISKLETFCQKLEKQYTHVLEFRHQSWFDKEVYDVLKANHVVFCILSAPDDLPEDLVVTGKTAYVRFHGKDKWYDYLYSEQELEKWKDRLSGLNTIEQLYVYFNNDMNGNAVKNASTLSEMFKK